MMRMFYFVMANQSSRLMNRSVIIYVTLLLIIYCFSGCLNDKADEITKPCDSTYYSNEIKPVFETKCAVAGCHVTGGSAPFVFTDYSVVFTKKDAMKYRINLLVSHPDHMPQGDSLLPPDLAKLNSWLDQGALQCK